MECLHTANANRNLRVSNGGRLTAVPFKMIYLLHFGVYRALDCI